mmetsp:Transcript_29724/g.87964  ORF Transcript_29724/g.87964 Transcript_29724/m.87964 type:complete len:226 (+) Transcript_29724:1854-2531(+)
MASNTGDHTASRLAPLPDPSIYCTQTRWRLPAGLRRPAALRVVPPTWMIVGGARRCRRPLRQPWPRWQPLPVVRAAPPRSEPRALPLSRRTMPNMFSRQHRPSSLAAAESEGQMTPEMTEAGQAGCFRESLGVLRIRACSPQPSGELQHFEAAHVRAFRCWGRGRRGQPCLRERGKPYKLNSPLACLRRTRQFRHVFSVHAEFCVGLTRPLSSATTNDSQSPINN